MSVHFSSATDEWSTPEGFAERYGPFDLDPCATPDNAKAPAWFAKEDDGLSKDWYGSVWMNPPYGREIGKWVRKAFEEVEKGNAERAVCLVPSRTDTRWWHDWCVRGEVEFVRGRLRFGGSRWNAPFPSAVVTFGKLTTKERP